MTATIIVYNLLCKVVVPTWVKEVVGLEIEVVGLVTAVVVVVDASVAVYASAVVDACKAMDAYEKRKYNFRC